MLSPQKINQFKAPAYTFTKIVNHEIIIEKKHVSSNQPLKDIISSLNTINIYDDDKNGYPLLLQI